MGSAYMSEADRRSKAGEKLGALVQSRAKTLSLLTDLASSQPFAPEPKIEKALRQFCEALIDYTASAHFQLYRYLADNAERRQRVLDVANSAYPKIVEITDVILRFNDRYEGMSLENSIDFLAMDLSNLGECLAERITLEDQIINAMSGQVH